MLPLLLAVVAVVTFTVDAVIVDVDVCDHVVAVDVVAVVVI